MCRNKRKVWLCRSERVYGIFFVWKMLPELMNELSVALSVHHSLKRYYDFSKYSSDSFCMD